MYKQEIKKIGIVIPKDSPPIRPIVGIIKINPEANFFIMVIYLFFLKHNLQELLHKSGVLKWIMMD